MFLEKCPHNLCAKGQFYARYNCRTNLARQLCGSRPSAWSLRKDSGRWMVGWGLYGWRNKSVFELYRERKLQKRHQFRRYGVQDLQLDAWVQSSNMDPDGRTKVSDRSEFRWSKYV